MVLMVVGVPAFSAPLKTWGQALARFADDKNLPNSLRNGKRLIANAIYSLSL